MAIAYINASTGSQDTTGAWTATCHAPGASGRIIILHVVQDGATAGSATFTSATNIENLAGTDNEWTAIGEFAGGGSTRNYLWIGRSLSTSAPTFTGGNSSGEDVYWRFYEFSGVALGTTLAKVIENGTAGSTGTPTSGVGTTVSDASVQTLGADRLALNFIGFSDDLTGFDGSFTGETGGDWATVASFGTSTGTDAALNLNTATMASAGTIDGGTMTITSMGWGVVGFALIPELSPTVALNTPADAATGVSVTPTLNFTGTDPNADAVEYNVQVDTSSGFDSQTTTIASYDDTKSFGQNNYGANNYGHGQSFTGTGIAIGSAQFYIYRVGTSTGNVYAKVYAHSGTYGTSSIPTGAALATSDAVDITTISGTPSYVTFTFTGANQITLTNGTYYVVTIEYTGGDATNCVRNYVDASSASASGNESYYNSGWGYTTSYDQNFGVYSVSAPLLNKLSTTDSGFTTGHPFASGVAKEYTVQAGDTLTNSTQYFWRVRAIDPTGSNTYGAWSSTNDFTTTAGTPLTLPPRMGFINFQNPGIC